VRWERDVTANRGSFSGAQQAHRHRKTLTTLAVLAAARSSAQPAPAQPRWECAPYLRSDEAVVWQAPDESCTGLDVYDVYKRLGGKLPRDKVANTEVLNLVGQKGWELVAVTHQPGPTMTFWFKRPAR
jgi:hypothetical protein